MGAIPQQWVPFPESHSSIDSGALNCPPPQPENPLQLLRDAIDRLNASGGELPDQAEVADLLAEAQEALERTAVVARASADCQVFLKQEQFERALEALDTGLAAYPSDAALLARRSDVEERQKAFHNAEAVRKAIEEANWLLDQDRIDLACEFLDAKSAELPDQAVLLSGLQELRERLPQWKQKRHVKAAVARSASLEQVDQGMAALRPSWKRPCNATPIPASWRRRHNSASQPVGAPRALQKTPRAAWKPIAQKVAAQSWRDAITLLDETRKEFPVAPELDPLEQEARDGLQRVEQESLAGQVRQYLVDGELEQAEELLRLGMESLCPGPELEGLSEQLASEKNYREQLRLAQVLFGRRPVRGIGTYTRGTSRPQPSRRARSTARRGAQSAGDHRGRRLPRTRARKGAGAHAAGAVCAGRGSASQSP